MLRRNQHAGGHAAKREADSHHPYRQPAAPAGADQALCETCARRAGRYGRAAAAGKAAMKDIVAKQVEAGVDIGNNGEQQRDSFIFYIRDRLSGLGGSWQRKQRADVERYPIFKKESYEASLRQESVDDIRGLPKAIGAIGYPDAGDVMAECADFRATLDATGNPFVEPFLTAPSPGMVSAIVKNEHYKTDEEFLAALGSRAAPRIQGDRRCRFPAATRLPGPCAREAQHLRGPATRRLHRVRQPRDRRDQRGDPRHSAREGAAARVLGQLRGPARSRCRIAGDHSRSSSAPRSAASCCRSPTRATRTSTAT